jgi:hypothetical protein
VYYEIAEDFSGFNPGAMWEDFKVGIEHLTRWDRVAVDTDVNWIGKAVRFFSFLIPATTRLFSRAEAAQVRCAHGFLPDRREEAERRSLINAEGTSPSNVRTRRQGEGH